jgi:predicted dehydrogenase
MSDLRLAVIGAGFIADLHVRAARECEGVDVVGVASHHLERAQAFAERHGIPRATTDWTSLAGDAGVDAVVICTPNALHAPQAIAALRAGKAVLVEKPMALTVAEGEAMVRAAEAAGVPLLVGHMWRYRDEVRELRAGIARGELGRVVRTHGYGVHSGWGPAGWFTDRALAGGGALIDMGVHAIDTGRFLLGDPEPVRVRASLGTAYGSYDVDDDGILLIDWADGARSVVEFGWWAPHAGGLEAETEVHGTGGYARIWPLTPTEPYEHCSLPMFAAQMADFVGRARRDPDHVPPAGAASAEGGLAVLRIVEAAYADAVLPLPR